MNPGLIKTYDAGATVRPRRLVKWGSADHTVIECSVAGEGAVGVADSLGSNTASRVDIQRSGIVEVVYGATVTRGQQLTTDSQGRAVAAAGTDRVIGQAEVSGVVGDIGLALLYISAPGGTLANVNATAAEINTLDGGPHDAAFTIGSESTNVINVGIQLRDANGADLVVRGSLFAYFSDDANGDSVVATAPSGAVAIGTDGLLLPVEAKKSFQLVSEADGDIDINVTESGAKTMYLILVLPNGKLKASSAITFAS